MRLPIQTASAANTVADVREIRLLLARRGLTDPKEQAVTLAIISEVVDAKLSLEERHRARAIAHVFVEDMGVGSQILEAIGVGDK